MYVQSVVVRPRDILGEKTDDDDGSRTSADLSESNSSCVDNVFDMYINCAKEACETRELVVCKTLAVLNAWELGYG